MSNNKLATIEVIHSLRPHSNADMLDIGMIRGFQVIVKKGQYTHGQKVIFIWPDTLCKPAKWNEFLDKKKDGSPIKISSCKLRGEYSTGVVLDLVDFPELADKRVGDEISHLLGVEKYFKVVPVQNGNTKGLFPSHYISKTDETLAQSCPRVLDELFNKDLYVTLKIDGQSLTFIRQDENLHVCSRNLEITEGDNRFWNTVKKYDLLEKTKGLNIAIQGEQYGTGIQKNPLNINEICLAIFNVKDLNTGLYYSYDELRTFCKTLNMPMVPILFEITEGSEISFDMFQSFADNAKYENGPAEGIVVRPKLPRFSPALNGMLSVKFINRNY